MARRKLTVKCPVCRQPVASAAEEFPFCSQRCRLIDLGKWASGHYVISSPVEDTSDDAHPFRLPRSNDEE